MFELSVALKYLTPRWRQLSVSIISLISILVIALVVWLIIVFFSVTQGLEKVWVNKLTTLTAPIRVTPTSRYYHSYYYLIDTISAASGYSTKSIGEKFSALRTNPYDPESDGEVPAGWEPPELEADGTVKDIVKRTFQVIKDLPRFQKILVKDYEMAMASLKLNLVRDVSEEQPVQSFLSQAAYLGSLDDKNAGLMSTVQTVTGKDITHLLESSSDAFPLDWKTVLEFAHVKSLKTQVGGWLLPKDLWPENVLWKGLVFISSSGLAQRALIPLHVSDLDPAKKMLQTRGYHVEVVDVKYSNHKLALFLNGRPVDFTANFGLYIPENVKIPAEIINDSIASAVTPRQLRFKIELEVQDTRLAGTVSFKSLLIEDVEVTQYFKKMPERSPPWAYLSNEEIKLPGVGDHEGVLLPKSFRDAGVVLGDLGFLTYYAATVSSVQEQQLPIYVAGFYDPGIIPIGGKYLIVNPEVASAVRAASQVEDSALTNGINVRFDDLNQADEIKAALVSALAKEGLAPYWKVETYKEFDFTKDLIQQLQSERNLWSLLSTVIIIVACSNIISMLIILVNDKKQEIGILRAMGASSQSIAMIFGTCGMVMGMIGSLVGIILGVLTLQNLQALVNLIGYLQGHQMFNPLFYGTVLPNEVSWEAMAFVMLATGFISLIAGIIPAAKACWMHPARILRSE